MFWGRAQTPGSACLCTGSKLVTNPNLGTFRAFRGIQQIAVKEAGCVFPFVLVGFVRPIPIDGKGTVIGPDSRGDQAQFDLVGG